MTGAIVVPDTIEYVQWFDYPGEPTGAAGDSLGVTYRWLCALTESVAEAEALALRVFNRTRQPIEDWLLRLPALTRLRIMVVTIVLAHRREQTLLTDATKCISKDDEIQRVPGWQLGATN